jgi:hypothetical protein
MKLYNAKILICIEASSEEELEQKEDAILTLLDDIAYAGVDITIEPRDQSPVPGQ